MKANLAIALGVLTAVPVLTILPSTAITPHSCTVNVVFDRNDTSVNVRSSPNGTILAKIPNGTQAIVDNSRSTRDWSFAQFVGDGYIGETSGYIKNSLISFNTSNFVFDGQDTFVNLRTAPNGRVLRKVTNGTPIDILSNAPVNGWVKVRLLIGDKTVGYMSRERISSAVCPG